MKYHTNFINNELLEQIVRNTVRKTMRQYRFSLSLEEVDRVTEKALRNAKRTINRYERKIAIDKWKGL